MRDFLILGAVMLLSLAALMTAMRLWTATILGEPGADMLKDWVGIVAGILAILSWFGLHGVHDVAHLFASDPH